MRSSIYRAGDGKWHGYVTMGIRPDGRPDRRHREGKTETEVTRKVRELESKRDAGTTSQPGRVPTIMQWMRTYLTDIAVREELISRNPCTLIDAPQPEEPETEVLTAAEARALLRFTAERRNGTRWSVAVALGFGQNEALGLRRSYVDLDKAVIHVHWQIQRERYRHGCKDPHACGERLHFYPVPGRLPESQADLRPQTSLLEALPARL